MSSFLILANPTWQGDLVYKMLREPDFQHLIGTFDVLRVETIDEVFAALGNGHKPFSLIGGALILSARGDYAVVHQIRKLPGYTQLPIILTRTHPGNECIHQAYAAGICQVVTFPEKIGRVRDRLVSALTQCTLPL